MSETHAAVGICFTNHVVEDAIERVERALDEAKGQHPVENDPQATTKAVIRCVDTAAIWDSVPDEREAFGAEPSLAPVLVFQAFLLLAQATEAAHVVPAQKTLPPSLPQGCSAQAGRVARIHIVHLEVRIDARCLRLGVSRVMSDGRFLARHRLVALEAVIIDHNGLEGTILVLVVLMSVQAMKAVPISY